MYIYIYIYIQLLHDADLDVKLLELLRDSRPSPILLLIIMPLIIPLIIIVINIMIIIMVILIITIITRAAFIEGKRGSTKARFGTTFKLDAIRTKSKERFQTESRAEG